MNTRSQPLRTNAIVTTFAPVRAGTLQRKCGCGQHVIGGGKCEACSAKGQTLQRYARGHVGPTAVPPIVHEALRLPGRPLDATTRAFFEARFGHDLSRVRVHTDSKAAASARAVDAHAYTVGHDLVFASGQYRPSSADGSRLIAHELAHVANHGGAPAALAGPHFAIRLDDSHEAAANQTAHDIFAGRPLSSHPAAQPALRRQLAGQNPPSLTQPGIAPQQSQGELLIESFLNRMWDAQSKAEKPFRVTVKVREGLDSVFRMGAPIGPLTDFPSTKDVMDRLRGKIPPTIDPNVAAFLESLPKQEKPLAGRGKSADEPDKSADPAKPQFPTPAQEALKGIDPDPRKPPEKGKDEEEAMKKALEAAFEQFRKTTLGQELEKSVKSYVFSKEGIPLDILIVGGVLTFVAANNPDLPSMPEIPIGDGIKLKFEYKGKATDLPPLLQELVKGQSDPTAKDKGRSEVKVGISVTLTFEAIAELAKAVGHFFSKAAGWIAKGIIKVGTVIGKAARTIWRELLGLALGAGVGALVGLAAGSAGVGALVGAGVGVGAALLSRLF